MQDVIRHANENGSQFPFGFGVLSDSNKISSTFWPVLDRSQFPFGFGVLSDGDVGESRVRAYSPLEVSIPFRVWRPFGHLVRVTE